MKEPWRKALASGERPIWSGRPLKGFQFEMFDLGLSAFGLVWLWLVMSILGGWAALGLEQFSFFGRGPAFRANEGFGRGFTPFKIIGPIFIAVGLYLVFGRFIWDMIVRSGTSYALTKDRAIIAKTFPMKSVVSIPITPATPIEVSGRSLRIGEQPWRRGAKGRSYRAFQGFRLPADRDKAYRLILDIQQGHVR